jgi:hypothetical protein
MPELIMGLMYIRHVYSHIQTYILFWLGIYREQVCNKLKKLVNIMVIGIAILKVMPGQEKSAYCMLKSKEGILDVYHIFGDCDFFVILRTEGLDGLKQLLEEFQRDHIEAARTILVSYENDMPEFNPVKALAC